MENPFPGMDPWMESQWGDAHHTIITYAREQIRPRLPAGLRARVDERVFVESEGGRGRRPAPDLRVVERATLAGPRAAGTAPAAAAEPLVVHVGDEPMTQGFIQIVETGSGGRLVTVVEVLSPSNKVSGDGQRLYLQEQEECRAAGVNFVEIDLLRGGQWVLGVPRDRVPAPRRGAYRACVWRAARPFWYEFYPFALREHLPAFHVPLRDGDPDVRLDLQPLVNQAYLSGDYDDTDYHADPVPPLSADDAGWADGILRAKGLR